MVTKTNQQRFRAWHVRMNGIVRGPFTDDQINAFWKLGWFKAFHQASEDLVSWVPIQTCFQDEIQQDEVSEEVPQAPVLLGGWLYRHSGRISEAPVPFAVLEVLVALGKLGPADEVMREGWADWVSVESVRGLICGPPEWCPVCDAEVHVGVGCCEECGVTLSQFQTPHTGLILCCGILGLILFPIVPLWALAIIFGRYDEQQIRKGMMDPNLLTSVTCGVALGWSGCVLFVSALLFLSTSLVIDYFV